MAGEVDRVAAELGLEVVRRLAGGEFGATLVNRNGTDLVLKVLASARMLGAVTRGTGLANRLRSSGYPAPEYVGVGTFEDLTWSLQRNLPGAVPDVMNAAHARAMLTLAERHASFAEDTFDWKAAAVRQCGRSLEAIRPVAPGLADELARVLDMAPGIELRRGDVVHSDFHHRNFLAEGDRVTGVFDWDLATPGDWRFDLVTLAFWSAVLPNAFADEARHIIRERLHAVCEPETLAFLTAVRAVTQLEFDARLHPERLPKFREAIEREAAQWWRAVL